MRNCVMIPAASSSANKAVDYAQLGDPSVVVLACEVR